MDRRKRDARGFQACGPKTAPRAAVNKPSPFIDRLAASAVKPSLNSPGKMGVPAISRGGRKHARRLKRGAARLPSLWPRSLFSPSARIKPPLSHGAHGGAAPLRGPQPAGESEDDSHFKRRAGVPSAAAGRASKISRRLRTTVTQLVPPPMLTSPAVSPARRKIAPRPAANKPPLSWGRCTACRKAGPQIARENQNARNFMRRPGAPPR